MNTLQFNFTIAFLKRNRLLQDLAAEDQIQHMIGDAYQLFAAITLGFVSSESIDAWFDGYYKEWAQDFCFRNYDNLNDDIRAALLHD
jgi:hypothetical protein